MSDPTDPSADGDRLFDLMAEFDEALVAGAETPEAGLLGPGADPELLSRLAGRMASLRRLHSLRADARGPAPGPGPAPRTFGRFSILRELGRGGCGVVFLANDPSLRREVALKVPNPEAFTSDSLRRRFQRKAQAAAALDHPNIIAVFECGEVGPVPYITSAFCPGPNLSVWASSRAGPIPARQAAEIVLSLAGAIRHAHSRGVLHRDLKPSNVLMVPPDGDASPSPGGEVADSPRLTDFGLASVFRAEGAGTAVEAGATNLTKSGMIFGTPAYMTPEQADGRVGAIGPATDVYGLGTILYELLTGRAPFVSESSLETLQQVLRDEPVPPRRLRPRLSRTLETICLKCLEKDPRRRYSTAAGLAEDLARYLDGRPIAARPTGLLERAWRWSRREPKVASLLALVVLATVAGFAGVSWQWRRAQGQTVLARAQRDAAEFQRTRAESHFRKARLVVDRLTSLSDEMRYQPRMEKTRRSLLEEVSQFYQEFLVEKSDDPGVRLDAAWNCLRLAEIYAWLGRWDQGKEAIQRADGLLASLEAEDPDRAEYLDVRVTYFWHLSGYYRGHDLHREALRDYDEGIAYARRLIGAPPAPPGVAFRMANLLVNRALSRKILGMRKEAEQDYLAAIEIQNEAIRVPDASPGRRAPSPGGPSWP